MTPSKQESRPIIRAESKADVEHVNSFFNSKEIKQALHRFTYSTTLERASEREDRRLYYTEEDGAIVGALMVWCESRVLDPEEAQIRLVAVSPDDRGKGIGKQLCTRAEVFAMEYGQKRISADVASTSSAREFWRAIGYEVAYEWETDAGREMNRMEKEL